MRKLFLFAVLTVMAGAMTGCLEYTEPQYSPEIATSAFFVNPVFAGDSIVGAKDTLSLFYDSQDDSYELDTVYVGDTVVFASEYYTVNSNLMTIEIKWDSTRMHLWYPIYEDVSKALTPDSKVSEGRLCFYSGYNRVAFPVSFSPLEKGGMTLKLSVESDSEFPISSVLFYIPVQEQVTDSVAAN